MADRRQGNRASWVTPPRGGQAEERLGPAAGEQQGPLEEKNLRNLPHTPGIGKAVFGYGDGRSEP